MIARFCSIRSKGHPRKSDSPVKQTFFECTYDGTLVANIIPGTEVLECPWLGRNTYTVWPCYPRTVWAQLRLQGRKMFKYAMFVIEDASNSAILITMPNTTFTQTSWHIEAPPRSIRKRCFTSQRLAGHLYRTLRSLATLQIRGPGLPEMVILDADLPQIPRARLPRYASLRLALDGSLQIVFTDMTAWRLCTNSLFGDRIYAVSKFFQYLFHLLSVLPCACQRMRFANSPWRTQWKTTSFP